MEQCEQYTEETRLGKHGATAQYWMVYIDLVELYLLFSRACRTNDLELYIYCLGRMCSIFSATSRPNYSRWMVRYHLNLLNIDTTHPGIRETLKNGGLSVRQTEKHFSRSPGDLTLEQTINADAASRLTGITAFSQLIGARKQWMVTRFMRSVIVGQLLELAGMKKKEDVTQELKPYRVERDNEDLQKIISGIEATLNPFEHSASSENLHCLTSGKAVSDPVKQDLIQCFQIGGTWCNQF